MSTNRDIIFNYLTTTGGFSAAAACGILSNFYSESGYMPNNLQNSYEKSLGYTDESYTDAVDNGAYSRSKFINDSAGYGLAQWTFYSRKEKLYDYIKSKNKSIADMTSQLEFFLSELKGYSCYNTLKNLDNTAEAAYTAGYTFHEDFERSSGGISSSVSRGNYAKNELYPIYVNAVTKISGSDIVSTAKSKLGCKYNSVNKTGPDTFNGAGLVYYCYKQNGVDIPTTAKQQGEELVSIGVEISNEDTTSFAAGDIIFFAGDNRRGTKLLITNSAIATGNGDEFIGVPYSEVAYGNLSTCGLTYAGGIRIIGVSKAENNLGFQSSSPANVDLSNLAEIDTTPSIWDNYYENMVSAISELEAEGDIYSTVINLRTGDTFKFYTNNSVSENFPVGYSSPGTVIGRSVPIVGYDSTGARTVVVSLDLFAGTNYRPDLGDISDPVDQLHKDLDLLKSFEYPDYSTSVVIPPPQILLSIGSTLRIKGVMQNLSIEYYRPFDSRNRPMYAKVSFTVTQVTSNPPDNYDIKNRSTTSF